MEKQARPYNLAGVPLLYLIGCGLQIDWGLLSPIKGWELTGTVNTHSGGWWEKEVDSAWMDPCREKNRGGGAMQNKPKLYVHSQAAFRPVKKGCSVSYFTQLFYIWSKTVTVDVSLSNNCITIKLWTHFHFFPRNVDNGPMENSLNFGDVLNSGMTLTFDVGKKIKNDVRRFLGFCTQNLKWSIFMELVLPTVCVGPLIIHHWVECCPCAALAMIALECLIKWNIVDKIIC